MKLQSQSKVYKSSTNEWCSIPAHFTDLHYANVFKVLTVSEVFWFQDISCASINSEFALVQMHGFRIRLVIKSNCGEQKNDKKMNNVVKGPFKWPLTVFQKKPEYMELTLKNHVFQHQMYYNVIRQLWMGNLFAQYFCLAKLNVTFIRG